MGLSRCEFRFTFCLLDVEILNEVSVFYSRNRWLSWAVALQSCSRSLICLKRQKPNLNISFKSPPKRQDMRPRLTCPSGRYLHVFNMHALALGGILLILHICVDSNIACFSVSGRSSCTWELKVSSLSSLSVPTFCILTIDLHYF